MGQTNRIDIVPGCRLFPGFLQRPEQISLLASIRAALKVAPLYQPTMPRTGKAFSVRMSNMGTLGWVSDRDRGYRYQETHPQSGQPWPPIPSLLNDLWNDLTDYPRPAQACLINYYNKEARMGLHVDADEQNIQAPIFSLSLGDRARFRLGGLKRSDPTRTFILQSGDILVLHPPMRMAYHGIDRIVPGSSKLLDEGGRFNLTLRRVK